MAGPFLFEGKTINAADNHDGTTVGLDIVKTSQTGAGNSADYLTVCWSNTGRAKGMAATESQSTLTT